MISRSQKNKDLNKEINYEKTVNISKKIIKCFLLIVLFFSIFFLYAYFIGVKYIKTNEYVIKDSIPNSFNGIKILHFSDLLYGKTIDNNDLSYLTKEFKNINPDITIFSGNLVSNDYNLSENDIKNINSFMKNIPYRIGKYAVRGNFDTTNFDLIFDDTDFTILDNEILDIYNNSNESINICGIDINKDEKPKLNNNNYTITIINNYDKYNNYDIKSNLILAGNNLGGEIKLFGTPLLSNNQYMNDYYEFDNSKIYISNGLGTIHHMRFMNHPSINVYRLISYY